MTEEIRNTNEKGDSNNNHYNTENANENVYNDSFTEMGSMSDLKSVPSASAIASAYNSPLQSSESEPEPDNPEMMTSGRKHHKWLKYKRFRDPLTGEEAVYELVIPKASNPKGLFTLCSELVTLSSISLFVASNLFAFTVGMLVGKRIAYDF